MSRMRRVRMYDLLEKVGIEPDFPKKNPELMRADTFTRTIHKDELIEVALTMGIDLDGDETVPRLRAAIMEKVLGRKPTKSPNSSFSPSNMLDVMRAIDRHQWLSPNEAYESLFGDLSSRMATIPRDTELVVNGETYEAKRIKFEPGHDEAPYERYAKIEIDDRARVMILFVLDMNECKYRAPVVLEEKVDYGPYARWKKDEYVKELEPVEPLVTDLQQRLDWIEVGTELKFEEPNVWLEVKRIKGSGSSINFYCVSSRGADYNVYYSRRRDRLRVTRDGKGRYDKTRYGVSDIQKTRA